jgi:hypothetical protein
MLMARVRYKIGHEMKFHVVRQAMYDVQQCLFSRIFGNARTFPRMKFSDTENTDQACIEVWQVGWRVPVHLCLVCTNFMSCLSYAEQWIVCPVPEEQRQWHNGRTEGYLTSKK